MSQIECPIIAGDFATLLSVHSCWPTLAARLVMTGPYLSASSLPTPRCSPLLHGEREEGKMGGGRVGREGGGGGGGETGGKEGGREGEEKGRKEVGSGRWGGGGGGGGEEEEVAKVKVCKPTYLLFPDRTGLCKLWSIPDCELVRVLRGENPLPVLFPSPSLPPPPSFLPFLHHFPPSLLLLFPFLSFPPTGVHSTQVTMREQVPLCFTLRPPSPSPHPLPPWHPVQLMALWNLEK